MMKYINKKYKIPLVTLGLLSSAFAAKAQADLCIKDELTIPVGSYIWVGKSVYYDATALQKVELKGSLEIKGDWYNTTADKKVFTDASNGVVLMDGRSQTFNGLVTRFPNLTLAGSNVKTQNTSIEIADKLNLNDRELNVNGHTVAILSSALDAIDYANGGYINTSDNSEGWLSRNMATALSGYVFPLGNNAFTKRFRPLLIAAQKDGFVSAQFQNYDPGNDSYSTQFKATDVDAVYNENFHSVKADTENTLTVGKFYNSETDGDFNGLVQWNITKLEWTLLQSSGPATNQLFTSDKLLTKADKFFSVSSLIVSNPKPARLSFGSASASNYFAPNVFTPNNDGHNDTFHIGGIENYAVRELVIVNRWGNEVYKSDNYGVTADKEWDGGDLNEGVYFYILKLAKTTGSSIEKHSGYIHLIRKGVQN